MPQCDKLRHILHTLWYRSSYKPEVLGIRSYPANVDATLWPLEKLKVINIMNHTSDSKKQH
jgi:hypothetical protein